MKDITINKKEELEMAMKEKYDVIYVVGELAEKIKNTEQLKKMSGPVLGLLVGLVLATPMTFGVSSITLIGINAAIGAAGGTAISLTTLSAVVAIGASSVFDMYKNYNIDISRSGNGYKVTLFLRETFEKLKDKAKE